MIVYELIGGCWQPVRAPKQPARANFVIVCRYGDWSGFRTLAECLRQIPAGRPDGFYQIEER